MLRALDGRYAFTPSADGTLVDYTLRVDLAVPLPGLVKRRASGMIMGNALRPSDAQDGWWIADDEEVVQDMTDDTDDPHPRRRTPTRCRSTTAGTEERPLPPPSILESVLTELLGAVPGGEATTCSKRPTRCSTRRRR